ncbi:MAG: DNA polymerase III subunit alpha [Pseudomonadota bacterium]
MSFVHLHCHTQYSLLDGAIRLSDLFQTANEMGMPAVAMTDHGNMHGAIEFYTGAKKAGLKPIVGCEVYVARGSRHSKEEGTKEGSHHLVLLCENETGYHNLVKLVSLAYSEGFYYRPRVDKDLLAVHSEGIIALSACLQGEVAWNLANGNEAQAASAAGALAEIFPGRFYLEMQANGLSEQLKVNAALKGLARSLSLPLVATNDCHYLRREDARAHDILLCVQTGKTVEDEGRVRFSTDELYFKGVEEMKTAFADCPEAVRASLDIAERCNLELKFGEHHFPVYSLPEGETLEAFLFSQAREGLERRLKRAGFVTEKEDEYRRRLEWELSVIGQMGFAGYFLIVADFISFARSRQIPVGPGRGSAAGSVVAWSLGITDIDPIAYGLIFERFLNLERRSMPDIDVDFCMDRRDEVIHYVGQKYGGASKVAQIATFGKMQARAVIRDVGRALNMSYGEVDRIAKLVPNVLNIHLEEALAREPRLRQLEQDDPRVADLLGVARSLEGLPRHISTHAAGVVVSDRPITDYLPTCRGSKGETITQYDMKAVEKVGLIKFDLLGLKTLTVIDQAVRLVRAAPVQAGFDITDISLADPKTLELLCAGDTTGVFQLESAGMRDLLTKLKPTDFEDVIALVALYRPGPLESGMVDDFIKRKHGVVPVKYDLPQLKDILRETYGVIVYQEQVMEIAVALAGYTRGEADILRRAMGKKISEVMAAEREKFMAGASERKVPEKKAAKVFDLMEKFAGYGFNKSHSAAYALVAFQTAYLKAHHPLQFMAALLTCEVSNTDNIVKYIAECRDRNLRVLPPEVSRSEDSFTVEDEAIRFGLAAVKNVGKNAIDSVVEARRERGFDSLLDFCSRVDLHRVNKRVIESLIKCGAFDTLKQPRARLLAGLDLVLEKAQREQRDRQEGQANLFGLLAAGGAGRPAGIVHLPEVAEWPQQEKLQYEKDALGFYISGHPLAELAGELAQMGALRTIALAEQADGANVRIGGLVAAWKPYVGKKGDTMAFVTLEDMYGNAEVIVFADLYKTTLPLIEGEGPLLVSGRVSKDEKACKLVAESIVPLKRGGIDLRIRLAAGKVSVRHLEGLRDLLLSRPGESRAVLEWHEDGSEPEILFTSLRVEADLSHTINGLLGYTAV